MNNVCLALKVKKIQPLTEAGEAGVVSVHHALLSSYKTPQKNSLHAAVNLKPINN